MLRRRAGDVEADEGEETGKGAQTSGGFREVSGERRCCRGDGGGR